MKTKSTEIKTIPCFECADGQLRSVVEDYTTTAPELGKVVVPNVPMERCDSCECIVVGDTGGEIIDAFLDVVMDAITPQEIQAFLDKYSLNQKEAAGITGYSEKMFSRWLRGHMRPSKSVSINLRTFLASREAFEIAKTKNWRHESTPKVVIEDRQPDDEEKRILSLLDYKTMTGMGLVKETLSPRARRSEICKLFQKATLQEVQREAEDSWREMAAFKDTNQASNSMSAGIWCWIGEQAAAHISVEPYDRDKLNEAVQSLREYSQHSIEQIIPEVQELLRKAGVALVFVPIMKESALRGCTKLTSPAKAVIVHGLKYRNHSQFWRVLFHEIAHLLLHITEVNQCIADYENQDNDQQEKEADKWADDTLVYSDELTQFAVRHPQPKHYELESFAKKIKTHVSIVAEVFNDKAMGQKISYPYLRSLELYPKIPETTVDKLGRESAERIHLQELY
ncbi:MAG: ImmA/IrrE family metallo-endopeptidase [Luteolibacter sp.]